MMNIVFFFSKRCVYFIQSLKRCVNSRGGFLEKEEKLKNSGEQTEELVIIELMEDPLNVL
jgi:hypothetical protein